jgi:hypothetical protein
MKKCEKTLDFDAFLRWNHACFGAFPALLAPAQPMGCISGPRGAEAGARWKTMSFQREAASNPAMVSRGT